MSANKTAKTTAKAPKKGAAKTAPKSNPKPAAKKLSALDAAAQILAENGGSMSTPELIQAMAQKKLWESPNGKTPAATLNAAIHREIATKGTGSRFKKTEPGKFAATGTAGTTEPTQTTEKPAKTAKGGKKKSGGKQKTEPAPVPATIPDGTPGPESVQELFRI
jgi:hypothetical protein